MPSELTIRPAIPDDVHHLVELATTTFRDTYRLLDDPQDIEAYVAEAFTTESFAAIVQDPSSVLLVALCGVGQYVGYALVAHTTPPPCVTGPAPVELSRLYLIQSAIGKGYGAVLMQAVHAVARSAGCQTVWLGVYDRNEHARKFYTRWGFVDVGTKDFLFGGKLYADPIMAAAVPAAVTL
ncbi:MAG: GNAT family N-acetyltransferase [Pseudomonadota bacterium]